MPYPNEHAARVIDPGKFEEESFRRKKLQKTNVIAIMGKLKGESAMTIQAYRFPKGEYTEEEAKAWLKRNEVEYKSFEAAEDEEDKKDEASLNRPKVDTQSRIDRIDAPNWMTQPFTRTPEGYLQGRAVLTNIGVFEYKDASGKVRREARIPEEVFHPDSVETLKMKPITNDHPKVAVLSDNVSDYQIGFTGSQPSSYIPQRWSNSGYMQDDFYTDGLHLANDVTITDPQAIEDIINGKREFSCGYDCELEKAEDGAMYLGMPYDYIQRHIRYNHVALIDKGRAGDAARLRLDSATAISDIQILTTKKEGTQMPDNLKKLTLDGVEYQAEAKVIEQLHIHKDAAEKEKARADQAVADLKVKADSLSKAEAERDTAVEENTKMKAEIEQLKKDAVDSAKLDALFAERIKIRDAATAAGVEIKEDSKDDDLKKATILAVFPEAKLDGKDAIYIDARFDAAVEILSKKDSEDAEASAREIGRGSQLPSGKQDSADAARERMIQRMHNDSRGIASGEKN